jgi:hypothetical protein
MVFNTVSCIIAIAIDDLVDASMQELQTIFSAIVGLQNDISARDVLVSLIYGVLQLVRLTLVFARRLKG